MWQGNSGQNKQQQGSNRPDNKEPRKFVDNHPARQGSVPGSFDSGANVPRHEREHALSQQILVYHESQPADTGQDWMYKLKEDSMKFLAEQRGVQLHELYRESVYKKGIETLIDKIFGLLQRYAFEFNQIARGTDLQVSGTISGDVTEVTRYNKFREAEETKTYFRARMTTRFYGLVMRGADSSVDFYVIPINLIMALSATEREYSPVASAQVKITEQGMMWRMRDGIPPVETLDELCMWLFDKLIQESKAAYIAEREQEELD